jgi:hypothetical protein
MPTTPLDIINCTPEEFFHQMVITKNIFNDSVVSDSRGSKHCITHTYQVECWKHSHPTGHPTGLRAVDIKGMARLHLKSVDMGIML